MDDVMRRLDKLERENAQLRAEVNGKKEVKRDKDGKLVAASNPVTHVAVATSPAPEQTRTIAGIPVKAGALGPLIDNTTVQIYGHFDLSGDIFNPSVYDQGTKLGISSNSSYFGIRVRHNLDPYGWGGWAVVAQMEAQIDAAAVATERASLGSRDSYLGLEGPWGAIKAGKSDSPYKKATAAMDPFANSLGDYNSIMGNTGGDNRAEFDWRMNHAVWYESPIWNGLQFSALFAPGQNYAKDNSDFAYGDLLNCTGASTMANGSNFPGTNGGPQVGPGVLGGQSCTDGSYGNAYSTSLTYKGGPWTGIAAFELHEGVNREGDSITLPDGSVYTAGVHNEWAAKLGGGYLLNDTLGNLQLNAYYEWLRRDGTPAAFNERSRDGVFASITQYIDRWSISASYAHAFSTPGNPSTLSVNNAVLAPAADIQANLFGDAASQYSVGARYRFSNWASWYVTATELTQEAGAHFCLGASGHGYQVCSRDAANNTIGGATLKAATTGITLDF
jgi:predicted porin